MESALGSGLRLLGRLRRGGGWLHLGELWHLDHGRRLALPQGLHGRGEPGEEVFVGGEPVLPFHDFGFELLVLRLGLLVEVEELGEPFLLLVEFGGGVLELGLEAGELFEFFEFVDLAFEAADDVVLGGEVAAHVFDVLFELAVDRVELERLLPEVFDLLDVALAFLELMAEGLEA